MTQRRVGIYAGIDPTAESMHVGHMIPFMALGWLYIHGYNVNFLVSGAFPNFSLNREQSLIGASLEVSLAPLVTPQVVSKVENNKALERAKPTSQQCTVN